MNTKNTEASAAKAATITQINLVTFEQRLNMLPNPPAKPVKGRGFERVELTNDEAIVGRAMSLNNPHVAVVSVRQAINGYGKIGHPKSVFVSPEFYALFTFSGGVK